MLPTTLWYSTDFGHQGAVEGTLSPGFRPPRIQLIAFAVRRLLVRIPQVQLGVMPLRLYDLGTLFKLPRFATVA
jgi:hypothetical protein